MFKVGKNRSEHTQEEVFEQARDKGVMGGTSEDDYGVIREKTFGEEVVKAGYLDLCLCYYYYYYHIFYVYRFIVFFVFGRLCVQSAGLFLF